MSVYMVFDMGELMMCVPWFVRYGFVVICLRFRGIVILTMIFMVVSSLWLMGPWGVVVMEFTWCGFGRTFWLLDLSFACWTWRVMEWAFGKMCWCGIWDSRIGWLENYEVESDFVIRLIWRLRLWLGLRLRSILSFRLGRIWYLKMLMVGALKFWCERAWKLFWIQVI